MTDYKLKYNNPSQADFSVNLPLSKSESNRLLLISTLSGASPELLKVSDCDDTKSMLYGLTTDDDYVNIGAAGTAMRFLTAFFAISRRTVTLDGSERMRKRPISPLVTALRELGAFIEYAETEGFPPLKIKGTKLSGGEIMMDASVSSQYVSALMMIAPTLSEPLIIRFDSRPVSLPYIKMTAELMHRCEATVTMSDSFVTIHPGSYNLKGISVEPDWSAASYWYEICALSRRAIRLPGLKEDSLQGDSGIVHIFKQLGVETEFDGNEAKLIPSPIADGILDINLEDMPDVAQTIAVTSAMIGKPFNITGLSTLPGKETDRLEALRCELSKLGYKVVITSDSISWDGKYSDSTATISIDTYKDHRMAMSFAPVAILRNNITINDIDVVSKSYPDYWKHLHEFGIYTV
ncbi:MAG: 3-phosphoshikimate 1-carboxyvinyltransferase [Muribaculaceae bacterium]|nr:3-phosphoshikimate 1-carboxyvinyltransferase [Muribaculaceae bacterium]